MSRLILIASGWLLVVALWTPGPAPAQVYYVYVACTAADEVDLVRFDPQSGTATVATRIEIDNPRGLTVSPDGQRWFVSAAPDASSGHVAAYRTGTHEQVGAVEVGPSPAAMAISPATGLLYVVNATSNDDEPGSVSVVDPETLVEVRRPTTGVMPRGSRLSPDGLRHYSVATRDGELIELNARTFAVTRRLSTASGPPRATGIRAHADTTEAPESPPPPAPEPTWVQPHPSNRLAYVAHQGSDEIVEVDLEAWTVRRRFTTRGGPFHLSVTPDGQYVLATQKEGGSTGVFNLERGEEVVRIQNSSSNTHGIAVASDGRYAFVSMEGPGDGPGAVDVIDLNTMERIATMETGARASGIAFWKADEE